MERASDLPGAAHLVLADGVVHLDPEQAVFEAMLAGWERQQRTRFLKDEGTIRPRLTLVRRMAEFTNALSLAMGACRRGGLHHAPAVGGADATDRGLDRAGV